MSENTTANWVKNRQKLAWEPEILITGVVLIGLLQIPGLLDDLSLYINDWGPQIFYTSNIDEAFIAFLKTSIFFLVTGLVITLLMRSVWVVMIAMSFLYPDGVDLDKFKFQPFFRNKIEPAAHFDIYVSKLDRICSLLYSITFFVFMCIVGLVFFILVIGGILILIYSIFPISPATDIRINLILNILINVMGGLYLLDFLTLGWFKRFKWLAKIYRPVYMIMSFLTLAPLYRNIYYALISRFNRWKIFAGLIIFILLTFIIQGVQRGQNFVFSPVNSSEIYLNKIGTTTIDGYYRDKNPDNISTRLHISSATVENNVLEVFVPHKIALENSIFRTFGNHSGLSKEAILANDSLRLAALSHFYRFTLDGKILDPIPFTMMNYTEYNQKGMFGFIPLDAVSKGQHALELYLNDESKTKAAQLVFYKVND